MTNERRLRPFHERFDIELGMNEARRRFVNRISNDVFRYLEGSWVRMYEVNVSAVRREVANALGERYRASIGIDSYVGGDFYRCLQTLETIYRTVEIPFLEDLVSDRIARTIRNSETDLGIDWKPPNFLLTGAKLLDEHLVNDPLHWLDKPKYKSVYDPFQNGLSHFLESEKKPHLLKTVIRDMYEAVEALAKIVTGRPGKDLSANAELFISKIKASDHYKKLLKDYIAYANEFRHAEQEPGARPAPSRDEVESFIYLTGLFIRLGVQEPG